jgi:threonyl-tRNA synthetase
MMSGFLACPLSGIPFPHHTMALSLLQVEMISAFQEDTVISCYKCGPMVDLCHGPHVPNTGMLKAVAINSMSRAFWRANVNNDHLQRVYGITFPDDKELKEYQHRMEEAKKRDHRNLGVQQVRSVGVLSRAASPAQLHNFS